MQEKAKTPSSPKAEDKTVASFFASDEFRRFFYISIIFLWLGGSLLFATGLYNLSEYQRYSYKEPGLLNTSILLMGSGALIGLLAMGGWQGVRYFERLRKETALLIKSAALDKIKEDDFEKFDRIIQLRNEKALVDFERNSRDAFLIQSFEVGGVDFFGPCKWQLRPGVNVLLGRNGYGKSLILRSLAALLQRNEAASGDLFTPAGEEGFLQLIVDRRGERENIRRGNQRFLESPGKIPILAIPDSRFVSRQDTLIDGTWGGGSDGSTDLRADGAWHFLEDRPYGDMMRMLFTELCFDYLEDQSFDRPVFGLLQRTINSLTGDLFRFHSVERVSRNAFRLMVRTEGNPRPLPIQSASQGTLSVLGVVGIIRSYLRALFPGMNEEECLQKPAIVLIDEFDAHLHPLWQQKLTGLLRSTFPNVQFVLTAHSPLIVAGCWVDEVTVLRRDQTGLVLQQLSQDFLGTSVEEIYKTIFGVEDLDDNYLQSASRATSGFSNRDRIKELEHKKIHTEQERRELMRLKREDAMVIRAAEVKVERKSDQDLIEELKARIEVLQDKLEGIAPRQAAPATPQQAAAAA